MSERRRLPVRSTTHATGALEVRYEWIYQLQKQQQQQGATLEAQGTPCRRCTYCHMVTVEHILYQGRWVHVAAFQASEEGSEGSDSQHIQFCRSSASCDPSGSSHTERWHAQDALCKCVAWGLLPLWSPVLKAVHPPPTASGKAATSRLLLFYSESRKVGPLREHCECGACELTTYLQWRPWYTNVTSTAAPLSTLTRRGHRVVTSS